MSEFSPLEFKADHKPNDTFIDWLKSSTALFVSQIAVMLSLLGWLASFIYYVWGHNANSHESSLEDYLQKTTTVLFVFNIVVCFIFVIFSIFILSKNKTGEYHAKLFYKRFFEQEINKANEEEEEEEEPECENLDAAKENVKKFKRNFLAYWIFAFFYYIISFSLMLDLPGQHNYSSPFNFIDSIPNNIDFLKYGLNNLILVFIYWNFSVLIFSNKSYYTIEETKQLKKPFLLRRIFPILLYLMLLGIYFLLTRLTEINNQKIQTTDLVTVANAISSIFNMIALCLLISRLDSKLIGLPSWITSILYGYAAIQPFDIALSGDDLLSHIISVSIYLITFIFKIYFFLILTYIMQTGRLLSYLYINSEMSKRLQQSRKIIPQVL